MALPTMKPSWVNSYKTNVDFTARRVERENDFRSKWENNYSYFKKANNIVAKNDEWTSERSKKRSSKAVDKLFNDIESREREKGLEERRHRLRILLTQEDKDYKAELRHLRVNKTNDVSTMQERVDELNAAKEEKRKKEAEQKLYDHWRQNEPTLRKLESAKTSQNVVNSWENQIQDKDEIAKTNRESERKIEHYMELENLKAQQKEIEKGKERHLKGKALGEEQRQQIHELRKREKEAELLRHEEEKLLENDRLLHEAEIRRKMFENERKKQDYGMVLIRQYKQQLLRKSKQVQEALEHDLRLLVDVAEKEKHELQLQQDQKQKRKADADYMKRVIEDQLRIEKVREAELDQLYQQEASRQWRKRESEWEQERLARERLISAVLEERQKQIQEKMEVLQLQKEESVMERERLLEAMEEHQQLTHREDDEQTFRKKQREQEIMDQITAREKERERQMHQERVALEEKRYEEAKYNVMLEKEAQQINSNISQPSFRRRRIAFT